jgi:hypothetical protein
MTTALAVSRSSGAAVNAHPGSALHPGPCTQVCYSFQTVDDTPNENNYVTGIEDGSYIVGAYSGDNILFHSFYAAYPYSTFTAEDDSRYASTFLQGLDNNATLGGAYQVGYAGNGLGSTVGDIYHAGKWILTPIQDPNEGSCAVTQVLAINDTRQGVGFYLKPKNGQCEPQAFEFYPSGNGYTYVDFSPSPPAGQTLSSTANGINTLGDVVGTVTYGSPPHNAVWFYSELKYYTFRNGTDTFGHGVNFNDRVVGDYVDSAGTHGFFVPNPEALNPTFFPIDDSQLSTPPYTVVNSINTNQTIAGWYLGGDGHDHGFVGTCNPCFSHVRASQRHSSYMRTVKAPIHYNVTASQ